jgi:hypothetical protein
MQDIPEQQDCSKESRAHESKCGETKGKTCAVICSAQQEAQNPRSHEVILILYHCIHYNQYSRLLLKIDTVLTFIIYFYLSVGGGTGITFSAGTTIIPL